MPYLSFKPHSQTQQLIKGSFILKLAGQPNDHNNVSFSLAAIGSIFKILLRISNFAYYDPVCVYSISRRGGECLKIAVNEKKQPELVNPYCDSKQVVLQASKTLVYRTSFTHAR